MRNLTCFSLVFIYLSLWPAYAIPKHGEIPVPSKFSALCQRILTDRGWIHPRTRAQIHAIEGRVNPMQNAHSGSVRLVGVALGGDDKFTAYARTNRSIMELIRYDMHFPGRFFSSENFFGKKVLDLACGNGTAVEQLRREGVDIIGLDIHLTPYMLTKPYYVQASAFQTGLPSETFDIIYSAQGPFTYLEDDRAKLEALMLEAKRILKPGGVLRLSPVLSSGDFLEHGARPDIDLAGTIYTDLPEGLRLKSWPDRDWFFLSYSRNENKGARYWLEIEKIK